MGHAYLGPKNGLIFCFISPCKSAHQEDLRNDIRIGPVAWLTYPEPQWMISHGPQQPCCKTEDINRTVDRLFLPVVFGILANP
jgi:hypothetical protein